MIDQEIIDELSKRQGKYDFIKLIEFLQSTNFIYKAKKINGLPIAIATLDCVYVDLNKLDAFGDKLVYFVLLHETAHMKRIAKFGHDWLLEKLSHKKFNKFLKHVFEEEIIADRYACLLFFLLNKEIFLWKDTQQLNLKHKQQMYEPMAKLYFGRIQNDINKYNELILEFIKKEND